MHTKSRAVTEKIQEAKNECSSLQGSLETAEEALKEASERLTTATGWHQNLNELLKVAEHARNVSFAVAEAHEAALKAAMAAQKDEDASTNKKLQLSRLMAQYRLQENSGVASTCTRDSLEGLLLVLYTGNVNPSHAHTKLHFNHDRNTL